MIAVTSGRFQSFLWLGLLVLLIAVVTAWYFLPIKDFVDFLSEWISKHGALGVVIFAVVYILLVHCDAAGRIAIHRASCECRC